MKMSYPVLAHQEICAENGMVAAQHPLGAQVGVDVLQRGGNAVDSAVTTAFAMGVLQPLMNGIGGGGVMVVFLDGGGGGTVDYGMQSPGLARGDMYELEDELVPPEVNSNRLSRRYSYPAVKNNANVEGHTSIGVPGTVAGLSAALEKWGSIDLDQAIAPAIRLAHEGFQLGHRMTLWLVENRGLLQRFPETASIYYAGGWPLLSGETWVQKDHAETLRKIARNGPDAFYKGDIAAMICDDITRNGGFLRTSDFEQYRPIVSDSALEGTYLGVGIRAVDGPNAGVSLLEILNIIEHSDVVGRGSDSASAIHTLIEATKMTGVDRFTFLGDPAITNAPLDALPRKDFAATRWPHLDQVEAAQYSPGDPWPFSERSRPADFPAPAGIAPDDGTTHLTVVDRHRNAVSLTQTNHGFSGVVNPGVGVMMNNAMGWGCPIPGTINSQAPHARAVNNMTPVVLHESGRLRAALGGSGGRRIWTALAQSVVNYVARGMSLQEAIQQPRFHTESDVVMIDGRIDEAVRQDLAGRGHELLEATPHYTYSPYSEPNGVALDGDLLKSAVYPVAKPNHAAGY